MRKSKLSDVQLMELQSLYLSGKKIIEIANQFGLNGSSVCYHCRKLPSRNTTDSVILCEEYIALLKEWEKTRLKVNHKARPYQEMDQLEDWILKNIAVN